MQWIFPLLLLIASGAALAAPDMPDEQGRLEAELNDVRQEQQSLYQNYEMTCELRRLEIEEGSPFMLQHPYGTNMNTPPPNFDDVLQQQQKREQHIQKYTSDLKELSAHYLELDRQRKALIKQIRELKQHANE